MSNEPVVSNISQEEMQRAVNIINQIGNYYDQKIVGQKHLKLALLTSFIANGHILLESVPGLGKTTAAKVLTNAVSGTFSRIQCTPDLLPSDIIGTQIYNNQTGKFETQLGPVYANFVLLDEINRSSSKTQSAMLEAMQEKQVTIGGKLYKMPDVFIVMATQNPIEQEGTYILSEAEQDRFLLKEKIEYPNPLEEFEILNRIEKDAFTQTPSAVTIEDLKYLQDLCKRVYIDDAIKHYITEIIGATRNSSRVISKELAQYVEMGSSPRGSITLMQVSKAIALINGRSYVIPDDIKTLIFSALRHRITLNYAAIADNIQPEAIINAIIGSIRTP